MNSTTSTTAGMRKVALAWDPNPAADQVTGYQLFLASEGEGWVLLTEVEGVEATVNLPAGPCVVAVAAVNSQGIVGPKSDPLTVLGEPSAPLGLKVRIIIDVQISAN